MVSQDKLDNQGSGLLYLLQSNGTFLTLKSGEKE
jgi:hypothetical protein